VSGARRALNEELELIASRMSEPPKVARRWEAPEADLADDATRVQPALRASTAPMAAVRIPIPADAEVTRIQPAIRDGAQASRPRGRRAAAETRGRRVRGWLLEIALVVAFALVISAVVRAFVVEMFTVPSGSMENTLLTDDRIVAVEAAGFHRGDIVVFQDPGGWLPDSGTKTVNPVRHLLETLRLVPMTGTEHLVKRVIGLPGDHVQCCDAKGQVMVNGYSLDERAYIFSADGVTTNYPSRIPFEVWVPAGRVFVMGDHRDESADSRYHLCDTSTSPPGLLGFVPVEDIVGPVKAIAMPLKRMQSFAVPATFAGVPDHPDGSPPASPVVSCGLCPA